MPDYLRYFVPGGTFFFTVVVHQRRNILTEATGIDCLREAFRIVKNKHPFEIDAIVVLPDHVHAIWTLPEGDINYPMRWRLIKSEFTSRYLAAGGTEGSRSASRRKRQERGIWQRRYWEHTIDDEIDFERHVEYIQNNAVKHGLVQCPKDWPHSSIPMMNLFWKQQLPLAANGSSLTTFEIWRPVPRGTVSKLSRRAKLSGGWRENNERICCRIAA